MGSSAGISVDGAEGNIGVDGISGSGVAIGLAQAPRMNAVARTVVNIMPIPLIYTPHSIATSCDIRATI